jgi:hypothetical protein
MHRHMHDIAAAVYLSKRMRQSRAHDNVMQSSKRTCFTMGVQQHLIVRAYRAGILSQSLVVLQHLSTDRGIYFTGSLSERSSPFQGPLQSRISWKCMMEASPSHTVALSDTRRPHLHRLHHTKTFALGHLGANFWKLHIHNISQLAL